MSYILDALTRSQKQRERATIPTLTTDYLIDGKTREPFQSWQWISIGLASMAVAVALYVMSGRPLEWMAQPGNSLAQAPASNTISRQAVTNAERSTHQTSAELNAAEAPSSSSQSEKDAMDRQAGGAKRVDARDLGAHVSPTAIHSGSGSSTRTMTTSSQSPAKEPEQRLKPESRWLVDELLALRRQDEHAMPRTQATSDAPRSIPGGSGSDGDRGVDHGRNRASQGVPDHSTAALPTLSELSPEMQAALPPLEVNVHAYSKSSEQRMVIINMKTYGEGDRLREGPLIDAITPTGVVLVFKDQRFTLAARR